MIAISILIVIACSTVIYSLFYISVMGKVKEYGRLRVIGITQKQIKKIIRKEGIILSLLSIPTGIVFGCIIGYSLIPDGWYWPNTIKCALFSGIITEMAVLLSIRKPLKIAASVSPIEAVRITTTTNITKFSETKKLHRKITAFSLAKINFKRNKKKTMLTLFSLGFTGILLMCTSTIILSIDSINMAYQELGNYELLISLNPNDNTITSPVDSYDNLQQNNPLDSKLISDLSENSLFQQVSFIQGCTANIFFPNYINVESLPHIEIIGLSREYFESHQDSLFNGSIDYDELVEGHGIIIDDSTGILEKFSHYKATVGDIVNIETDKGEKLPFTVKSTIALNDKNYKGYYVFIPEDLLYKIKTQTSNFNIRLLINTNLDSISQAEDFIYGLCGNNQNIEIKSISEVISFMEQSLKATMKALYGIVIFIGIFALINLINTLMTNLVSRQREFGLLQSIGLTNKQLSNMLQAESIYYVLNTMGITLTVGTVLGYLLCWIFTKVGLMGTLTYSFPYLPMLVFLAALTLIATGYSILAIRYCKRKSLVEQVKTME